MIAGAISSIVFVIILPLFYMLIKGAISYFGKKGAEHMYENREEYKQKGQDFWENRRKK